MYCQLHSLLRESPFRGFVSLFFMPPVELRIFSCLFGAQQKNAPDACVGSVPMGFSGKPYHAAGKSHFGTLPQCSFVRHSDLSALYEAGLPVMACCTFADDGACRLQFHVFFLKQHQFHPHGQTRFRGMRLRRLHSRKMPSVNRPARSSIDSIAECAAGFRARQSGFRR